MTPNEAMPPASPIPPAPAIPVTGLASAFESLLRQPAQITHQLRGGNARGIIQLLLLLAVSGALIYGAVVGSFSGGTQLWAAPLKISLGLLVSALICLPSLYIFACLSGAETRLSEICGLVAGLLALMTVLLLGFAPVAWVFSQSTESVVMMGGLHLAFWGIATYFGLRFLLNGFSAQRAHHPSAIFLWAAIFMLVMLQMSTALRPIVGEANTLLPTEKKFFLLHWAESFRDADITANSRR